LRRSVVTRTIRVVSRFRLEVEAQFEAAHHLSSYRGSPEPSHGHSWKVSVELAADRLDSEGMAFDFVPVRAVLGELAARFDHRDINTVPPFDRISPTTENLAVFFCEEMRRLLPRAGVRSATVWEGPACRATYSPDAEPGR
jgi:6-pyruvoyltetrahydropterin/6-carboxytetrahydropterin synthase